MNEDRRADGPSGETREYLIVARLLETPSSAASDQEAQNDFTGLLRNGSSGEWRVAVGRYLGSHDLPIRSAIRLLDIAVRAGDTNGGLWLVDRLIEHYGRDEALIDFRLRLLLGLRRVEDLLAECDLTLASDIRSIHLAFRVVVSLDRISEDGARDIIAQYRRALAAFSALAGASREEPFWWARYYREIGNAVASLKLYRSVIEQTAPQSPYRAAALRESGELALAGDRWGRDAPFLLQAAEEGVEFKMPWRAGAAATLLGPDLKTVGLGSLGKLPGTAVYSHVHDVIGSPESAFDFLIDEVLPRRAPYQARNALLMIGTSLAAGGMERIFANSYRAVKASGVFERVAMALMNFECPGATAFYLPETGAEAGDVSVLHSPETPQSPVSMLPLALARRVWGAYELIERERPRVIHAWNDLPGIVAAFAGLLAGCPRIFIHFHHMRAINLSNDRNLIRSYPACYRRLLERAEIELLFVADASADDYADWWSVERGGKFRRLYNGFIDMPAAPGARETLRGDLGIGAAAPVLGAVFRFDRVKRTSLWIDTAAHVARQLPEARFIMVGGGAEWEEAHARVESLGLTARFNFPGQVRNVADYLACMDAFMLTSRVEGLPNSLVEAQLAGVPVVSTDVGGARETFVPGVTGRLVDVHTPEALAAAAIACLTDQRWREEARVKSRSMAVGRFGIDRYLTSLISLYEQPHEA
jgi:glycosyltransferase involved in cell wall biosynthesis